MRRLTMVVIVLSFLVFPVQAMDFSAPEAPEGVAELIPENADSFGEGLWNVVVWALRQADDSLDEAISVCVSVLAVILISAVLTEVSQLSSAKAIHLCAVITLAGVLLSPSSALISLAVETSSELNAYGKLLLPVMTSALAARGGVSSSASLYAATAMFNAFLSSMMTNLGTTMLYLYLSLSIGAATVSTPILSRLRDLIHWGMTWVMKITLYLFTGYITVTGVVAGNVDAASLRTAKIAISGAVPIVGGILSDASEAVLVSAGTLGSAAGVYGMITVLAMFAGPFVRIGIQYLLLSATAAIGQSIDESRISGLISSFTAALGVLLAMISTQTVLLLISTLCFMKGVT